MVQISPIKAGGQPTRCDQNSINKNLLVLHAKSTARAKKILQKKLNLLDKFIIAGGKPSQFAFSKKKFLNIYWIWLSARLMIRLFT